MSDEKRNKNNALAGKRLITVAALFMLGATGGCSLFGADSRSAETIQQKVEKEVWHMRDMYVRLEAQDAPKGGRVAPNQQPVNISPDQLYNAFSQITINEGDKTGYTPLFTEFELGVLSKNISAALAEARPDQDVTFAVVGWHKGGGLFTASVQKLTTGRVFYQGGRVNLILGAAHRPVEEGENFATQAAVTGDRRLDPFVPGMRSFTQPHKWHLAAASGSGVYGAPGGKRSDWLVFSAQALAAAPPPAAGRPGAPSAAEQARYEQLRQQMNELQQQLQTLQGQQGAPQAAPYPAQPAQPAYPGYQAPTYPAPAYPAPGYPAQPAQPAYQYPAPPGGQGTYGYQAPAPAPAVPATPPGKVPSGGESVQQRLLVLDDLKNKGLISDTEYQQKRAEILSGH